MTWGELMGLARTRAGLNQLDGKAMGRNGSVIRMWLKRGLSEERIAAAIQGAALMRDRGELWIPRGRGFGLWALEGTHTLVNHGDGGEAVRLLFDAAEDAYYRDAGPEKDTGRKPRKPEERELTRAAELLKDVLPQEIIEKLNRSDTERNVA